MRILLLEDENFMAEHIEQSLHSEFSDVVIVRTSGAAEALAAALDAPFDCLIFDRMVKGGDGLDVLRELRERGIETPAIMLSQLNDIEHRTAGLDFGADDYLGKSFEPRELAARIRAATRRGTTQGHPRILKIGDLELHRAAKVAEWRGQKLKLTPKEFGILLIVIESSPHTASYEAVWFAVWREEYGNLSPMKPVIHTTVSRLRGKLADIPGIDLAATDDGYLFKSEP